MGTVRCRLHRLLDDIEVLEFKDDNFDFWCEIRVLLIGEQNEIIVSGTGNLEGKYLTDNNRPSEGSLAKFHPQKASSFGSVLLEQIE